MKNYLFILRTFNDIDHLTPVMWKMASDGSDVRAVFVDKNSNIEISDEPRFRHLERTTPCRVRYFYALDEFWLKFPNRLLVSPDNPLCIKFLRVFNSFLAKWIWSDRWADAVLEKMNPSVCVVDSHDPDRISVEGKLIHAAKRKGVPVLCLSHGPNVFTSFDPNDRHTERPVRAVPVGGPEYPIFDRIVAQSPPEVALWKAQGFDMKKIVVKGCPRYSPEWVRLNLSIQPPFTTDKLSQKKFKVLFFMPHWGPYVNKARTLDAVRRLAEDAGVYLVVKEHTREGAGDLPDSMREDLAKRPNAEVIRSARSISFKEWSGCGFQAPPKQKAADSVALVAWADVVVCFGTSIGIEALCQKKLLINPVYLYDHATMYEAMETGIVVRSEEELTASIARVKMGDHSIPYSTARLDRVIIFGDREPHEVMKDYADWIVAIGEGKAA